MDNSEFIASAIVGLLVALLVALGIFLLIRSIMLWYWKITDIVNNQKIQNTLLKDIKDILERTNPRSNGQ
jgi:hypothetical protein